MKNNSFFQIENKRILLVVPHPDDELNVIGSLYEFFSKKNAIKILFVTSGDKNTKICIREGEAKNVEKLVGGTASIYFMHYPDCYISDGVHFYNKNNNFDHSSICFSKGINLVNDIFSFIQEFEPDYVFFNGYDRHPDHKMVFLSMLRVAEKIVGNKNKYPNFFYGYAYETAYNAPEDYLKLNFKSTQMTEELFCQNFSFWEKRERFPVLNGYLEYRYKKSRLYPLLKLYRSQHMAKRFLRIQNSDHVFWRLPSLRLQSKIISNKNLSAISRYLLFDSDNVLSDDFFIVGDKDSHKSFFSFRFEDEVYISSIIIIGNDLSLNYGDVSFSFSSQKTLEAAKIKPLIISNTLSVFQLEVNTSIVSIEILKKNADVYRIFVDDEPCIKICKICYKNDFVYNF